jgi:acyl-CoA thioester hydrolase
MDAYGHVNNAVFLNYLEAARDQVMDELFGEQAYDFVLAHVSIDYRHEITQADAAVTVSSRVTGWGRSSVRTAEVIRFADGTLAAESGSVVVARDPAAGSSRPLTAPELTALTARWAVPPG